MRVAIFSEVYWPMVSGVGITLSRLTDALHARDHEVRVYTATYPIPDGSLDRPEVHRSRSIPLPLYPDVHWAFPSVRAIAEDAARFKPDLVHVATEVTMGLAGLKVARRLGIPVVASAHTDYQKYAERYNVPWAMGPGWVYLRWFYGQTERVLCPSHFYQRFLQSKGIARTGLWTRGADLRRFNPDFASQEYRRRLGVGPDDLLVSFIGRLAKEKDLELLVEVWQEIAEVRGTAQLALVGRGPMEETIRLRRLPGVHVLGLLQDDELSTAYASTDIFVFPSPTETFGNSLLEAMASGLPCIAADVGGVLEFARHEENALLARAGDRASLRGSLLRLLQDAELRRRLRAGALHTASERHWDEIYDGLIEEYGRVARVWKEARRAA
jgi:phosphatidylinositol alpha 1,6-mannosyltransferase